MFGTCSLPIRSRIPNDSEVGMHRFAGNQWMTVIAIHDVLINVWKGSRNWS